MRIILLKELTKMNNTISVQSLLEHAGLEKFFKPGTVSDGYHTFDELYEHRQLLFCLAFWFLDDFQKEVKDEKSRAYEITTWKSKKHYDGTMFEGYFIAGFNYNGKPGTYHLEEKYWHLFCADQVYEKAPKWDGHTSNDVLNLIKEIMGFDG